MSLSIIIVIIINLFGKAGCLNKHAYYTNIQNIHKGSDKTLM